MHDAEFVLDADESRASFRRDRRRFLQLRCRKIRASDFSNLSSANEVIERAERLRNRDRRVGLMELIEIDSIGSKPPQAVFRRPSDVLRAGALAFRVDAHPELRRDHHAVAASRQRMSQIDFAVRRTVDVGRVEEGDAGINGGMNDAAPTRVRRSACRSYCSRGRRARPRAFRYGAIA